MKTQTLKSRASREAVEAALEALAVPVLAEALLPGVDVSLYQGMDGAWHADVLLDRGVWPELPLADEYGRESGNDKRWWYSRSEGLVDYSKPKDTERSRTPDEALAAVREWIAQTLCALATTRVLPVAVEVASSVKARHHFEWPNGRTA